MPRYIHTTDAEFKPGDIITPLADRAGKSQHAKLPHYDSNWVYLWDDQSEYSALMQQHGQNDYEVEPLGEVEPDTEISPGGSDPWPNSWRVPQARVIRQIDTMKTANILDPIHDELSPLVFDNPADPEPVLKPEHHKWIVSNVYRTLDEHGYDGMDEWLHLIFTGSLTTYQYSDESDVDISLFVDVEKFPEWSRAEMIAVMVDNMDGVTLPDTPHPMQCFVVPPDVEMHNLYKPGLRSGYDLKNPGWVVPPERDRVKDVKSEKNAAYVHALQQADKMERLLRYEPSSAVNFWHQIHDRRRRDMKAGKGDYADSNIVYKFLANRGLMPLIAETSGEYIARHESRHGSSNTTDRISQLPSVAHRGHDKPSQSKTPLRSDRGDERREPIQSDDSHIARTDHPAQLQGQPSASVSEPSRHQSSVAGSGHTIDGHTQNSLDWIFDNSADIDDSSLIAHPDDCEPPASQNPPGAFQRDNENKSSYQLPISSLEPSSDSALSEASGEYIAKTAGIAPLPWSDEYLSQLRTEGWEPGTNGKALYNKDRDELHTWQVDGFGGPHHQDMQDYLVDQGLVDDAHTVHALEIDKGGQADSWGDFDTQAIAKHDPRLKPATENWEFTADYTAPMGKRWAIDKLALRRAAESLGLTKPVEVEVVDGTNGFYRDEEGLHRIGVVGWLRPEKADNQIWHELKHAKQSEEEGKLPERPEDHDDYRAMPTEVDAREFAENAPYPLVHPIKTATPNYSDDVAAGEGYRNSVEGDQNQWEFSSGGDQVGPEYHGYIAAVDPETQKVVGQVTYRSMHRENYLGIRHIEVLPEYQRKGLGTALMNRLYEDFPDIDPNDIDLGMTTDDGTAFFKQGAGYKAPIVRKFVYNDTQDKLIVGDLGKEEGEHPSHFQLMDNAGLDHLDHLGTISESGWVQYEGGSGNAKTKHQCQEALKKAVPELQGFIGGEQQDLWSENADWNFS